MGILCERAWGLNSNMFRLGVHHHLLLPLRQLGIGLGEAVTVGGLDGRNRAVQLLQALPLCSY